MANEIIQLSKLAADLALGFNPRNVAAQRPAESAADGIMQSALKEAEEEQKKEEKKSKLKKTALRVASMIPGPQQPFVQAARIGIEASGTLDPKDVGAPQAPGQLGQLSQIFGGGTTPAGTVPEQAAGPQQIQPQPQQKTVQTALPPVAPVSQAVAPVARPSLL